MKPNKLVETTSVTRPEMWEGYSFQEFESPSSPRGCAPFGKIANEQNLERLESLLASESL